MSLKCPDCGASLTDDSRFCRYCGAKIDDGVKRTEIKIDKHVEDVAEIRRAEYEEKESLLRQKKMKRDLRKGRFKTFFFSGCAVIAAVLILIDLVFNGKFGDVAAIGLSVIAFPCLFYVIIKLINS